MRAFLEDPIPPKATNQLIALVNHQYPYKTRWKNAHARNHFKSSLQIAHEHTV